MRETSGEEVEFEYEETNSQNEADFPPEFCHYRDEGCELAASCLNCPFTSCVYEEPGGRQRWLKRWRDKEIAYLYANEAKGIQELAVLFGLSIRTVQRALKASLKQSGGPGRKNNRMEETHCYE